jgi:hypothetical protein
MHVGVSEEEEEGEEEEDVCGVYLVGVQCPFACQVA